MNEMHRIKNTDEIQSSLYPQQMLWVPVQDLEQYLEERIKKLKMQNIQDYDSGILELEQIRIKIRNTKEVRTI